MDWLMKMNNTITIGLIAAMSQESDALLRFIPKREAYTLGSFRAVRFQLADRSCVLATSGMGIEHAADCVRRLVATAHPQLLLSFGIAGAVNTDLNIGDVVVSSSNCTWGSGSPGPLLPLALFSKQAWEAAVQALLPEGARLAAGTAITTRGSQVMPGTVASLANPILEMETAGIAQAAIAAGIPLLSIRSISDGPKAPIPLDLEAIMDEQYALRIGKILGMVIRNPRLISQLQPMMQNSAKAARCCALAVLAALSQTAPIISL
jgi:adenosylhomocysteine nucleosidase